MLTELNLDKKIDTEILFCKPLTNASDREIFYSMSFSDLSEPVSFRSFDASTDLDLIHNWVNQPYAKKFWQLDGPKNDLQALYINIMKSLQSHSFIGHFGIMPVCQIDIYSAQADELKNHINLNCYDCGFHLLMMPPRHSRKSLSIYMLKAFLHFYFSFKEAERIYAEPDEQNEMANLLARRIGLKFQKKIEMSYKTANLYSLTKSEFHETNQIA